MRFYPDGATMEKMYNPKYSTLMRKIRELEVNMESAQIKRNMSNFNYFAAERNLRIAEYHIIDTSEDSSSMKWLIKKFVNAEKDFLKVSSEIQEPVMKRSISMVNSEDYLRKLFFI